MGRIAAILGGVLILAVVAGGLTEATLAFGRSGGISDDTLLRPLRPLHAVSSKTSPKPSATPGAKPSASPSPPPAATPATAPGPAAASGAQATTNSFVHLRASNSTSSNILANLDGGTVVKLMPYSDSLWQEVQYNGQTGYIYRSYLNY
jgi:hypothetical protein